MSDIASFRKVLAFAPQPSILLQVVNHKIVIEVANKAYLQLLDANEASIVQNELFFTPNFRVSDINRNVVLQLKESIQQCIQSNISITLSEQPFTVYRVLQNKIEHFTISFTITPIAGASSSNVTLILLSLTNDTEKTAAKKYCEQLHKQVQDYKADIAEIESILRIGRWEIDVINNKIHWSD